MRHSTHHKYNDSDQTHEEELFVHSTTATSIPSQGRSEMTYEQVVMSYIVVYRRRFWYLKMVRWSLALITSFATLAGMCTDRWPDTTLFRFYNSKNTSTTDIQIR